MSDFISFVPVRAGNEEGAAFLTHVENISSIMPCLKGEAGGYASWIKFADAEINQGRNMLVWGTPVEIGEAIAAEGRVSAVVPSRSQDSATGQEI